MPYDFLAAKHQLARDLWNCGVILTKKDSPTGQGFELVGGGFSPVYVESRVIPSHPAELVRIAKHLSVMMLKFGNASNYEFDYVADVPHGVTPIVTMISVETFFPMLMPREPKGHGSDAAIYGHYKPGSKVALFEDSVTTGGSVARSGEILRQGGLEANHVFALIDREQGGRERLREEGYELVPALTLSWLLQFGLKMGFIELGAVNEISRYLEKSR